MMPVYWYRGAAYGGDPLALLAGFRRAYFDAKRAIPIDRAYLRDIVTRPAYQHFRALANRPAAGFAALTMCERAIRCDLTMRELLRIAA